jgi:hypothetical protein
VPGQDESTLKPSKAKEWHSRFDHSAPYDLALVFGEATLADGRILPAEYHSPPSVAERDRWMLSYERVIGRWVVPYAPRSLEEAAARFRAAVVPEFDLANANIFPLVVRTFAPRYAGAQYELVIANNGQAADRAAV